MKKLFVEFLILLLLVGVSNAGERKTTMKNTLLDIGECNSNMCIVAEKEIEGMLFQEIDFKPYNGKCNFVILFKKIIDPKQGVLYSYYDTQNCRPK